MKPSLICLLIQINVPMKFHLGITRGSYCDLKVNSCMHIRKMVEALHEGTCQQANTIFIFILKHLSYQYVDTSPGIDR